MTDPEKPMTHTAWAKHYRGGKFVKWVQVGEARLDIDANGAATIHAYEDRTVRGDTGYTCYLPIGVKPPAPPSEAKRPGSSGKDGEMLDLL